MFDLPSHRRLLAVAFPIVSAAALGSASVSAQDTEAASLADAFKEGKFSLNLRYRFEQVSDDAPAIRERDAQANTLRTTFGFATQRWHRFGFSLYVEDVTAIGTERYNNSGFGPLNNGVRDRPVIADPDNTELSQVYLSWAGPVETRLQLGRQELSLDNERFVGPVGWRQNHQELDAFNLRTSPSQRWSLHYAYVDRVHTITGAEQPMSSHLLNLGFDLERGRLTAYSYWLEYDRSANATLSTMSAGLRFAGHSDLGPSHQLLYELELAEQRDRANNPADVDVGYQRLELGLGWKGSGIVLRGGIEILEGDGRVSFRTPLATLHKFNGYADKFLTTPPNGLEDVYAGVWGKAGGSAWHLVYHRFSADRGGIDYGDEIDLQLVYGAPWKQTFGLKLGLYQADTFAADTDKAMLWTAWGF